MPQKSAKNFRAVEAPLPSTKTGHTARQSSGLGQGFLALPARALKGRLRFGAPFLTQARKGLLPGRKRPRPITAAQIQEPMGAAAFYSAIVLFGPADGIQ